MKFLFLLLFILSSYSMMGQETSIDFKKGDNIIGSHLEVFDQYHENIINNTFPFPYFINEGKVKLKLYFDESLHNHYSANWKVKVYYEIILEKEDGTILPQILKDLEINFSPQGNYRDIALEVFNDNKYISCKVNVKNLEVKDEFGNNITPFSPDHLANDIILELSLETNRFVQLDPDKRVQWIGPINNGAISPNQDITIVWNYLDGATNYDLEWLFIDMANKPLTKPFNLDFSNATRVNIKTNHYSIPIAYTKGILIYRVRGIGKGESSPGVFDKRVEGRWSVQAHGTFKLINTSHPKLKYVTLVPYVISEHEIAQGNFVIIDGAGQLDPHKNWQYQAIFSEGGKRKEVLQYFDDALKPDQTITLLNTDEIALVSQNIPDFLGQTTLQILPAPQSSKGLQYYNTLNYNSSDEPYSIRDFDLDNNINIPNSLEPIGNLGAGHYFSNSNTNPLGLNGNFTPDAKGYPFVRTIRKNDGSGRISKVSGMGKEFFDGGITHETSFFYSHPTQEFLCKLFGNNVGFSKYYDQTIAVDPNGQTSLAIKDLSGSVVLTALMGKAPNLLALDTEPDTYDTIISDLSRNNELSSDNNKLVINEVFSAVGNQQYEFEYQLDNSVFSDCGISDSCKYNLNIYILNEYGQKIDFTYNSPAGPQIVNEIYIEGITEVNIPDLIKFNQNFTTGSYQVVKELTLNNQAIQNVADDFLQNQTCYEREAYIPITDCDVPCTEQCENEYISPIDSNGDRYYYNDDQEEIGVLHQGDTSPTAYAGKQAQLEDILIKISQCTGECTNEQKDKPLNESECEVKERVLKGDMSPGGQYFDDLPHVYLPDGILLNTNYNKNGWLNKHISNMQRNAIYNCLNLDQKQVPNIWDYMRDNWQDSYADILVQFHPEYCGLKITCCYQSNCEINTNSCNQSVNSCLEPLTVVDPNNNDCDECGDFCVQFTQDEYNKMNTYLTQWEPDLQTQATNAQALLSSEGVTDPDILNQFSYPFLRDRAQNFLEEYFLYKKIEKFCCNVHLNSPTNDVFTSDGYEIRFPKIPVFEEFDLCNPQSIIDSIDNNCSDVADQMSDEIVNKLRDKCGVYTESQLKAIRDKVRAEYFTQCLNPDYVFDLKDIIQNTQVSGTYLPSPCILDALPEDTNGSCECKKINQFVYDSNLSKFQGSTSPSIIDVLNIPGIENTVEIQNNLDILIEDPAQRSIANDFPNWFRNCNEVGNLNWQDPVTPYTYYLPDQFSCESQLGDNQPISSQDCAAEYNHRQIDIIEKNFQHLLQQEVEDFKAKYKSNCLTQAKDKEHLSMTSLFNYYHFTLYYYDQAKNLVATVPPAGIFQKGERTPAIPDGILHNSVLDQTEIDKAIDYMDGISSTFIDTQHLMVTNNQFNSLNNLWISHTPDGGETQFWHDALGRLVVSQNAEQNLNSNYSYINYDELGRTIESGEITNTAMNDLIAGDRTDFNIPVTSGGNNALLVWKDNGTNREKLSSFYDDVNTSWVGAAHPVFNLQNHLRNRISAISYDSDGDGQPNSITHYSYDVLGNVTTLWQENRDIPFPNQQVKRMDYDFDLISGNVNQFTYQPGEIFKDQFIHKYSYDADNRIVKVQTSTNGEIYDTDARYFYYAHGPLARIELGDKQVSGQDYFYNIQGWIKGMNSSVVNGAFDAGKDGEAGTINQYFGKDAFAFSLHYYNNDYSPINPIISNPTATQFNIPNVDSEDLYNGNIAKMVSSLTDTNEQPIPAFANAYRYDVLNRIKQFKPYWDQVSNDPLQTNIFNNVSNYNDYFNTSYTFDGNGNLTTLLRNSQPVNGLNSEKMDDLKYNYDKVNNTITSLSSSRTVTTNEASKNNKLLFVNDFAPNSPSYFLDIKSQSSGNYTYDAIGRLTRDHSEELTFEWNVANKVKAAIHTNTDPDLHFGYGPMGNRIMKDIIIKTGSEPSHTIFYVLDAQGNPMATYKLEGGKWILQDFTIYGIKRLGTLNVNEEL